MIRRNRYPVVDSIVPWHVLVSVFDKTGIEELVEGLLELNALVRFYSTGGTGKKIKEILGERAGRNYVSVEDFTGSPEMEGGLVKTLHPKIHAGLLAERNNPAHETYLFETMAEFGQGSGVYFDVLVSNLYPFKKAVAQQGANAETARINIDIGGPGMTMAACKNWHSVAVLSNPGQYSIFCKKVKKDRGISAELRFVLAQAGLEGIGEYRKSIANYFSLLDYEHDVFPTVDFI